MATPDTTEILDALAGMLSAPKVVRDQDKMVETRSPGDIAGSIRIAKQLCDGTQETFTMEPAGTEL